MSHVDDTHEDDPDWVSKSAVKREMIKLQAMGERLLTVKAAKLKEFPLTDELVDAIEENKRIKSHEARRRHLQYIGKQMRNADIEGIQRCLDKQDPSSDLFLRTQNQADAWRQKLIKKNDMEQKWFDLYPQTERQTFRALIRAAKKEQPSDDAAAPIIAGKNTKKLLKLIKEQLSD